MRTPTRQSKPAGKPRFEMSQEHLLQVGGFNETQTDWYGRCRVCGEPVSGSLSALRAHRCGDGQKATE